MIDLFYPPQVNLNHAKRVKGRASFSDADRIKESKLESWLQIKQAEAKLRLEKKEQARRSVEKLKRQLEAADKSHEILKKEMAEMVVKLRSSRKAREHRKRSLDRAIKTYETLKARG